jgi:putative PEP-CTERM system histidine kinase
LFWATYFASAVLLNEFVSRFLRDRELTLPIAILGKRPPVSWMFSAIGVMLFAACLFLPLVDYVDAAGGFTILKCNGTCSLLIFVHLIIVLYTLFILENTFRFSQEFQRKIARFCFIALALLLAYQVFFSSHVLLYKYCYKKLADISTVVYGVTFPVMLIGLLRYRLGSERVTVPRNAVYSTVTLFLAGAAFLGIGLTATVFKRFHLDFSYFGQALLVFSLCLFALLLVGSGGMRKRISQFINNRFYLYKYDYREQFFNLYRSYMTGEDLSGTLTEIIENMKYSVAADDAYIFLKNDIDGRFYMHENKERATASGFVIQGDGPLIRELSRSRSPVFKEALDADADADAETRSLQDMIHADMFFPITSRQRILGVLALRLRPKMKIDKEDLALITVFADSIGDVLVKNKVLTERVERKQFESFSHMSSFIIHDIKNQSSTLSLLAQNAKKNIVNPEFQKSLLTSLESCSVNLQHLVDKLKSPPKPQSLKMKPLDINSLVERVVENTGIATIGTVAYRFNRGNVPSAELDEESLFYALKNLVVNALEAMNNQGTLTITTGPLSTVPDELQRLFGPDKDFLGRYKIYVLISDTGKGMSAAFIETKLFHPFMTTKDKGIGIGLYQCKTLIETMGGKIICRSEENRGTRFCIVL